jgi:hypothetical protein
MMTQTRAGLCRAAGADPRARRGREPPNRFARIQVVADLDAYYPDDPGPRTVVLRDPARSLIGKNDSPDVSFRLQHRPYNGCEHGCL